MLFAQRDGDEATVPHPEAGEATGATVRGALELTPRDGIVAADDGRSVSVTFGERTERDAHRHLGQGHHGPPAACAIVCRGQRGRT